jgi:hypothetical protein
MAASAGHVWRVPPPYLRGRVYVLVAAVVQQQRGHPQDLQALLLGEGCTVLLASRVEADIRPDAGAGGKEVVKVVEHWYPVVRVPLRRQLRCQRS